MKTQTKRAAALILSLSLGLNAALGLELSAGNKTLPPTRAALLKAAPTLVEERGSRLALQGHTSEDPTTNRGLKAPPLT